MLQNFKMAAKNRKILKTSKGSFSIYFGSKRTQKIYTVTFIINVCWGLSLFEIFYFLERLILAFTAQIPSYITVIVMANSMQLYKTNIVKK